jgi:hypothetical protein
MVYRQIIKEVLLEYTKKTKVDLSNTQTKQLLKDICTMGYLEDDQEVLNNLISWYNKLPQRVKIYRLIFVDDQSMINTNRIGSHFSYNKKNLIDSHYETLNQATYGEHGFLITAFVDKEDIDTFETLKNNILFPNEMEITVKNKGKNVEIKSIKKIEK